MPGLGHPQHSGDDPRATVLLDLADQQGVSGDNIAMLRVLAKYAPETIKRPLPTNVSGALSAVMLNIGSPLEATKEFRYCPVLPRAAGLVAHLFEKFQRSIEFIMSHHANMAIGYDGATTPGDVE